MLTHSGCEYTHGPLKFKVGLSKGGAHEVLFPTEKLLAADGCWGGEKGAFFREAALKGHQCAISCPRTYKYARLTHQQVLKKRESSHKFGRRSDSGRDREDREHLEERELCGEMDKNPTYVHA